MYLWSQTAASNATADDVINFREGQAPSSLNDAGRGLMSRAAMFRDDITGALETTGTAAAYVLASNQNFNPTGTGDLPDGITFAFRPHVTNALNPTMNPDATGAKPLRLETGEPMPAACLIAGTPYRAYYNLTDDEILVFGALDLEGQAAEAISDALAPGGAIDMVLDAVTASTLIAAGAPTVIVEEQQTSGTDGGDFASGGPQTRELNTLVRNVGSLVALSSHQVVLPAGTYYAAASAPAGGVFNHQISLANITDSSVIARGTSEYSPDIGNDTFTFGFITRSTLSCVFTIAGTKTIALQHQCNSGRDAIGFGLSASFGTEVYARLELWKLA